MNKWSRPRHKKEPRISQLFSLDRVVILFENEYF